MTILELENFVEPEEDGSARVQLARHIVDVELEVGDVDEAGVLMDVKHVGVQPWEVKDILGESGEGQLEREHLSECPVVGGRFEGGRGPFFQHWLRYHRILNLFQNFSEDLKNTIMI